MKNFRNLLSRVLAVVAIVAIASGCSAEAKKAHLARRAEEFLKAGDYEKAKIEYTNLLRADPKDPIAYEKIGVMWLEEGTPLRAGPFLLRAQELAPSRAEIKTKLAEVFIALGGSAEARKEAMDALALEPGNESAMLILADSARTPGEIEEAAQQLKQSKRNESVNYFLTTATLALRKNDLAALQPALQKAIAADPKSATAHLAMARYLLASRNFDAAGAEFKAAVDLAPLRSSAHLLYAEFKAQMGARDEAVAHISEVVKKAPDFLPAWTLLAKYAAQKNIDEAVGILENVFRRDPQNFDARMLESEFYIGNGDTKKAIGTLRQLESAYAKVPLVKYQLARAFLKKGDNASALACLDQAIALAPDYGDALLLMAEVNLRNGNPATAASAMEQLVQKMPTLDRAQVLLADAYRALGRFDDAAVILRRQVEAKPNTPEPYLLLGVLLRQQGKTQEARQALEKAAELSPDRLTALNQLVEMDLEAKDFATASRRVSKELEKSPDAPGYLLLEGKIAVVQQDWPRAETALLKVLQLNPNVASAYELLVSTYLGAKKLPQAVSQIEAFLAKSPNNTGALMTLALIHTEMKEYEKARDAYEKVLAVKPDLAAAANNLASIYADQLHQLDKGHEWAGKAHSIDPGNATIIDTYGWILYREGDYKQAVNLLKEAAEKMPADPGIQYHSGMASYMMGDTQSARVALEVAMRSPKDFPGKEEARRRLGLLSEPGSGVEEVGQQELEALLKDQPNDPVALTKLAEVYEKQGAAARAASTYEQALKINPTFASATLKLAQLYAGPLQNKDRALELAKKARDLTPGDAGSAGTLGRIAFQIGNYAWAYSLLQESVRQLGDDSPILKDFAWAAYSLGRVPEARQLMERVLKATPDSQDAKTFLALTAQEASAPDASASEAEARRVLAQDPAYVPALLIQAHLQVGRGQKDAAITAYNEVLSRFPDFAPAQRDLAALYLEDAKEPLKAYDLANNARKTMPDDSEVAAILGEASYYKKEYGRAIQLLRENDRKKPLDAKGLFYLGMSLVETKQVVQGRELLERSIKSGLTEPLASEAAKVLKQNKKSRTPPATQPLP